MNDLGRYRKLYVRLWRTAGWNKLTDAEKVLVIYLLTGPQTNRLGLFVLSIATAAEELGTVPETLKKRLGKVCETFGWHFDPAARLFYIPSWWRWNPPENVNVMRGALKDLNEIPVSQLLKAFCRNTDMLDDTPGKDGKTVKQILQSWFIEHLPERSRIQDQEHLSGSEQEQEQEQAALRAEAENGTIKTTDEPSPDARFVKIAIEVLREARGQDTEYLVDHFLSLCGHQQLNVTKAIALAALAEASTT